MALALLDAGHRVVAMSRTQEASNGERFHGVAGDVRAAADCERAVREATERFGGVDGLINNAGVHLSTDENKPKFFDMTEEQWRSIVETHLTGAFLMTRAVAPHLIARGWGRIVNHETTYGTMMRAGFSAYGAAKAGLEAATVVWSQELIDSGVTVNAILPGGVANVQRISSRSFPDRAKLVQPGEMGPPIVWLMSDASAPLTGHRVNAHLWDRTASDSVNLAAAATPAGWRTVQTG